MAIPIQGKKAGAEAGVGAKVDNPTCMDPQSLDWFQGSRP